MTAAWLVTYPGGETEAFDSRQDAEIRVANMSVEQRKKACVFEVDVEPAVRPGYWTRGGAA